MPENIYPLTFAYKDTSYTVHSNAELWLLPDSILSFEAKNYYYQLTLDNPPIPDPAKPYEPSPAFIITFAFFGLITLFGVRHSLRKRLADKKEATAHYNNDFYPPVSHQFKRDELSYTDEALYSICQKYNPFFLRLPAKQKLEFIKRVKSFIVYKDFHIVGEHAYREMPVLMAAAAIQISFGLPEFQFPHFKGFVIHPEEYIAYDPLRILVGNVQGKYITVSWKHFLEDFDNPADGKNVGLHEMAHALQVQYLFENYGINKSFRDGYLHYDKIDDNIVEMEKLNTDRLFDDNALRNSDEFWATSVELFFERPLALKNLYPDLYKSISVVLNQDPAAMI